MNNIPRKGIYSGILNAEYHGDKHSYSSSLIKLMNVPALGEHYLNNPPEYKDCYRIGTAIHTFLLEPELFDDQFFSGINCARRSKEEKQTWGDFFTSHGAIGSEIITKPAAKWYAEFQKQTGRSILTDDELKEIKAMAESVGKNKQAMELLIGGDAEQSVYWTDKETGLNLRCRPDFLNAHCSDLKSVQSVKPQFFAKKAYDLGYHISQGMYQDGLMKVTGEFKPFRFICIEKTAPYLCAVYSLDDESAELGYNTYKSNLKKLAECLDSGIWPGYEDNDCLSLPVYAFPKDYYGLTLGGIQL